MRERLLRIGNTVVAEAPEFLSLCQVVYHALRRNTCGKDAEASYCHWTEMRTWHETMINPKTRRVRLATIAELAKVPLPLPRLRNALFRLAYWGQIPTNEQINNGQVFVKTITNLSHLTDSKMLPILETTEEILEHWHIRYKAEGAFGHLKPKDLHILWTQVEPQLVYCVLKSCADGKQ